MSNYANYSNGKIYIIRSPHADKVYVGSTVSSLKTRWYGHNYSYKRYKEGKGTYGSSSFEIIDAGDAYIELIVDYPCNDRWELQKGEERAIRMLGKRCVNIQMSEKSLEEVRECTKNRCKRDTELHWETRDGWRDMVNAHKANFDTQEEYVNACDLVKHQSKFLYVLAPIKNWTRFKKSNTKWHPLFQQST